MNIWQRKSADPNYIDHNLLHQIHFFDLYNRCLDYDPEKIRNDLESIISQPNLPALISYEDLTGVVFNSGMKNSTVCFDLSYLDYYKLISLYQNLFGKSNVSCAAL